MIQSYKSEYEGVTYCLFECRDCQVQFWDPLIQPGAVYYETEFLGLYRDIHAGRQSMDVRYRRFLNEFGRIEGLRILDVGCGDGLILQKLRDMGNEVWGIDVDSRSVQTARARGLHNIHCADLHTFVDRILPSGTYFDLVILFDVLEHLPYPLDTFRVLQGIINNEGLIVGTVPNRKRFFRNCIRTDFPPHHFYRFDETSLLKLFEIAKLNTEKVVVFEYGYACKVFTDILAKKLKIVHTKANQSHPHGTSENSIASSDTTRSLRHHIAILFAKVIWPLFTPLEYFSGRGFKLFFVASSLGRGATMPVVGRAAGYKPEAKGMHGREAVHVGKSRSAVVGTDWVVK